MVETVVEVDIEQFRTDPCFRMVVDGKIEQIMGVYVDGIAIAGSDDIYGDLHSALTAKFPTNNLGELTWYACCAVKCNWELGM